MAIFQADAQAPGLLASALARLKETWIDEHNRWKKRDLSARHYVDVWMDGIHLQAQLEDAKQCTGPHRRDAGGQE